MKYPVLCLAFYTGLILSGCSHTSELSGDALPADETDVDYSITYYIHADSGYLYHTPEGNPVRDNSEVLTTAIEIGEAALSGEVFIYHQRPEKKFLGIFPRKASRFYHYKNGKLTNRVLYRHLNKKESFLATEAHLMNRYRSENRSDDHQDYFLYFGHEIPSENGEGYHRTLPAIKVNTASLTEGIHRLMPSEEDKYDLVVLSTCNNGTPGMAEQLLPFSDAMLASPQNLHLSHIDSEVMRALESKPATSPLQLAQEMAEQTYQRLSEDIQTTITLALYDLEQVQNYIKSLASHTTADHEQDLSLQFRDNVDCAEIHFPDSVRYRDGVQVWYKPARFGRKSSSTIHSGWGCRPAAK